MEIQGKLRDDIISDRVVLFLGAGVGQAAGLLGTKDLSEFLYEKAGRPEKLKKYSGDLQRLVASFDRDTNFTRQFINKLLLDYFNNKNNYKDLSYHKKLLHQPCWKSIYTTNYDICLELSEDSLQNRRLIPVIDGEDTTILRNRDANKLKYFKIHGCTRNLEYSPEKAPQLVITQRDFRESLKRKKPLIEELENYLIDYQCSIVFIGFSVQYAENDVIMGNIQSSYDAIANTIHQPFRPFAVLKNVDDDTRFDLEHSDINLLEGSFEDFIDEVEKIKKSQPRETHSPIETKKKIYITANGKTTGLPKELIEQNLNQFSVYHDSYFEEQKKKELDIPNDQIADRWKSQPSDMFLATNRYIKRSQFDVFFTDLSNIIKEAQSTKSSHIFHVTGDRACGKSVLVKQLANHTYEKLNIPVIVLSPNASTSVSENGKSIEMQGWDVRLIDKFISNFQHQKETDTNPPVTLLVADHLFHKQSSLDILLKYLENHNKPCVLLLTSNESSPDEQQSSKERIFNLYNMTEIGIDKHLNNLEIDQLFDSVKRDRPEIELRRHFLINKAKEDCHRDLLFILYTWFDNNFRKLEEIIIEESAKLAQENTSLRGLYLTVALFHQYNYSPRISLCAEAQDIGIVDFSNLNNNPTFKAFLKLVTSSGDCEHLAFTRHPEFARRIIRQLIPNPNEQIEYISKVIKCAKLTDLPFIQGFLIMIFSSHYTVFNVEQITTLKEASEHKFANDWVLNHQFGTFLIKEHTKLADARFYLDKALEEVDNEISKSSITHSLGTLKFAMFRNESDKDKALIHYEDAEIYFENSRAIRSIPEEHGYVTNIDLISHRLEDQSLDLKKVARLIGKKNGLIFEAFTVVPSKRQNYLLDRIKSGKSSFSALDEKYRSILLEDIEQGKASPLLLQYYLNDLLARPKHKTWIRIKKVIDQYSQNTDLATMIIIALASKKSFISRSESRFEQLRVYYDRIINDKANNLSFILVSEYIRLLMIDAIVLNKYDYIRSILPQTIDVFRDFKPRFLGAEYILPNKYYSFDIHDITSCKELFSLNSYDFNDPYKGKRYTVNIKKSWDTNNRYAQIYIDPNSGFFIKCISKELPNFSHNLTIEFSIKYTYEGFLAYDIIS